ncbi:hypothetical protein GP486_007137 [Trichoglossum hirsutum]|uniref:Uncharacterized protein n=1 Tax=Trichoglossum hirsutum TaxID=265104 RepID=A0A9P8IGB5_9PEZI|nr:hypothetical protein GP486_007137 [Trichoglossum hirsutum]
MTIKTPSIWPDFELIARKSLLPTGAGRRNLTKLSYILGRAKLESHRKDTFEEAKAKAEGQLKVADGHKSPSNEAKDRLEDVSERAGAVGDRSGEILETAQKKGGEGSSAEAADGHSGGQSKILEAVAAQERSGKYPSVRVGDRAVVDAFKCLRGIFETKVIQEREDQPSYVKHIDSRCKDLNGTLKDIDSTDLWYATPTGDKAKNLGLTILRSVDALNKETKQKVGCVELHIGSFSRRLDLVIEKIMSLEAHIQEKEEKTDFQLDCLEGRTGTTDDRLRAMIAKAKEEKIPENALKYIRTVEEFVEVLFGIVDMMGGDVSRLLHHTGQRQDIMECRPELASKYQAIKEHRDALNIPHNFLSLAEREKDNTDGS